MTDDFDAVLAAVGPRLRELRHRNGITLTALSETTGIAVSTLSRLESGHRKPGLELLLPIARAFRMPLETLVDAPATGDPRIFPSPVTQNGMTVIPLTRKPGGLQVFKQVLGGRSSCPEPDPRSHEGYHWLYVLNGRLRLILGDRDMVLGPGEVVEFDTHLPHWFGNADERPTELLSIVGPQGERFHLKARYRPTGLQHSIRHGSSRHGAAGPVFRVPAARGRDRPPTHITCGNGTSRELCGEWRHACFYGFCFSKTEINNVG